LDAAVLQSQSTDLNLGTFETPLSDKPFILSEIDRIDNLETEAQKLTAISALVDWDVPRPGGFFDKLGSAGSLYALSPHLDLGEGAGRGAESSDPGFYFTPHQEALGQDLWKGSLNARLPWTSFTVSQSQGVHPLTLQYAQLDPQATYELSILFFAAPWKQFATERNTVVAGQTILQFEALSSLPMRRISFLVPQNETDRGSLRVKCTSRTSAGGVDGFMPGGCSIVAVWLEPINTGSLSLHV